MNKLVAEERVRCGRAVEQYFIRAKAVLRTKPDRTLHLDESDLNVLERDLLDIVLELRCESSK